MATGIAKNPISGTITYEFHNSVELQNFLDVLERGLKGNELFNEDIVELADDIRDLIERS